jgi:hypothetical protein
LKKSKVVQNYEKDIGGYVVGGNDQHGTGTRTGIMESAIASRGW